MKNNWTRVLTNANFHIAMEKKLVLIAQTQNFQLISSLPIFLTTCVSQIFYCLLKNTFYFYFFDISIHEAKNMFISLLPCFR